ncbi:unnamed protein product [Blepharisma stoltei]|uniref:Tubulin-tyrosine ligase family protein n=1 Tax=Blepharisma stoltei TaxID=1481888 RepID=A0AAU9JAJ1_9CILI|nr:unnamed protein product [Blepharisma stoltei]
MEIELPAFEEIYDFNETDLHAHHDAISKALQSSSFSASEKWTRKAQRILELIEIEIDERVSINQITMFCVKEFNSDLYKEIEKEEISTQATIESNDEYKSESREDEDIGEKLWKQRGNIRKNKDFVKNVLKNTHVEKTVVIGGSSVPVAKKVESFMNIKPTVKKEKKIQDTPIKKKELERKDSIPKFQNNVKKPTKTAENKQGSIHRASSEIKEKEINKKSSTLKRENSLEVAIKKKNEKNVKDLEKDQSQKNAKIKPEIKSAKSELKKEETKEKIQDKRQEEIKEIKKIDSKINENPNEENKEKAIGESQLNQAYEEKNNIFESKLETQNFEESCKTNEESHLLIEEDKESSSSSDAESKSAQNERYIEENFGILEKSNDKSDSENELKSEENIETGEESIGISHENSVSQPDFQEEKSVSSISQEISAEPFTRENPHQMTITIAKPTENLDPSTISEITKNSEDVLITQTKEGMHFYSSNHQKLQNIRELISKNKKEQPQESQKSSDEEEYEEEIEKPALEPQIIKAAKPPLSHKPQPKPAQKEPPKQEKKTPVKKSIPRPPKETPIDAVDYTGIYKSFLDIFAGSGKIRDFNAVAALREAYQMFKEFQSLLTSPEFEIHTKFKLSLAPLEINPRDLVNQGKEFLRPSVPCDKEMYFRVVRARPEVYDIVSRGFNKKKGWNELPHGMNLKFTWNVMWTWSKPRIELPKLLVWQKVNHFPETKNFSRKDLLKKNIERIMKASAKCNQLWKIIPQTYCLPQEYVQFVDNYTELENSDSSRNVWIMKPIGKSRGRGISVINDLNQVTYGEPMVIQRYIMNPLLLDGYKFDLRLYILITSFSPLEVFLYKEGFARVSTVPFSLNPDKLSNKFIHLTNSSIQKYNQNSQNETVDAIFGGTKLALKTLKERLGRSGVDWEKIWAQIKEIVLKSLIAVQSEIPSLECCFDLVGYDVMIDSNCQCWLIEINSSPSLARENYLDDLVKQQLIDDTLDLVDPLYFNHKELLNVLDRRMHELQKGQFNNCASQMNIDLTRILGGKKPRPFGQLPEKVGNYELISPSPLSEKLQKLAYPRGLKDNNFNL